MLKKNRPALTLFASLVVLASLSAAVTYATAQRSSQLSAPQLSAAELDKVADAPSLEATVLRLAAEKLRKERTPTAAVELPLTIRVRAVLPFGCHETCVMQGTKLVACTNHCQMIGDTK
jgi:hypothetical protein